MSGRQAAKGILVAVAAVFVMAIALPSLAAPAGAAPVANANPAASQQWAYGAQRWVNTSVTLPNLTYSAHAFFGYSAVFTRTNTSATSFELEAQRTASASLYADLCVPNCASPIDHANLSATAWETDTGFSNFTTQATVYEHGNATSAFGIVNASAMSAGNLSESLSVTAQLHGMSQSLSGALNVKGQSNAAVSFSPALGLIPWNVTPGTVWNSSAMFTAMGAWSATWSAMKVVGNSTISASGHPSANVSANGTVSLVGADLGTITLANNQTVPVIVLAVSGPFDDVDAVILVPHDFDLFGTAAHDWDAESFGVAHLLSTRVDVRIDPFHHDVRFEASAATATGTASSLATTPIAAAGTAPAAGFAPSSTDLQAQPESVSTAQQQASCYSGACGATASPWSAALIALLVVGLVVALVVGVVATVEYRRRLKRRAALQAPPPAGAFGTPPPPVPPPAPPTFGVPPPPPPRFP